MINDFKENQGYVPTKLQYDEVSAESPGFYGTEGNGRNESSVHVLETWCTNVLDMENVIKKNFL